MISIVIVSHSKELAQGVRELAEQMVPGQVPIAVAGGIDDVTQPIGTDPHKVQAAIESVYSDAGVLVLMDIGSALLSAEMALEFMAPEQRANVLLCAAPLVEGAIAAAVQAAAGGSLERVAREARGALAAKIRQLDQHDKTDSDDSQTVVAGDSAGALTLNLTVNNRLGLHARPAAHFVKTANQFNAAITINKDNRLANAQSINQIATLGVRQGESITILASGPDAAQALVALQALADRNFGDPVFDDSGAGAVDQPGAIPESAATAVDSVVGIAAAPGIAIGPIFHYRPRLPEVVLRRVTDVDAEWERLVTAIAAAREEIGDIHRQAGLQLGADEAAIFEAHRLFLEDPELLEAAKRRLFTGQINAEVAWQESIAEVAGRYRALPDDYMRSRAADILDVGQRVLRHLMALELPSLDFEQPSILAAVDLSPSDTVRLDPARTLGICLELGGLTAHSTILARALGIPAVASLGPLIGAIPEGQIVALNGAKGHFWTHPDAARQAELKAEQQSWLAAQEEARLSAQAMAVTKDGRRIEVAANIGRPQEISRVLAFGAEGVGLFRTEFLFMDWVSAPSEVEQMVAYRQVAQALGQRPLVIRTLDVGGDKPLSYLQLPPEENPFLGWRGIRLCLDLPGIFRTQLRAILRASVDDDGMAYNVKLMFPMIATIDELRAAKAILATVQDELRQEAIAFDETIEVGIMIEVPAAVAIAEQLAAEVDFFSIGTNDLTQHVMAADRGNARVAQLVNPLQPAVLRYIEQTVAAARSAGIWVGVCGEMAADPLLTPLLLGLGIDELSLNAPAIPAVKTAVRQINMPDAQQIASKVLALDTVEKVSALLNG